MNRNYISGLFVPDRLAPELKRWMDGRCNGHPSPALADWLRDLDSTVSVLRRGVRPATGDPFGDWLSVDEAARELGYQPRHVRRLCDSGRLRAEKPGGDVWKIAPGSVARFQRLKALRAMSAADRTEQRTKVLQAA